MFSVGLPSHRLNDIDGGDRGTKADWSFYNRGLSEEVIKWETTDFSYHSD